jgi:DNA repair photolyase
MIISASRRTDIPAFYSEWFINRIREGYVLNKNPFNANQIKRIPLTPYQVDAIVFWTRNPKPLMKHLDELDEKGFNYYFQYTITGYPRELEKHTPHPLKAIETFIELSNKIGKEKVIWRYDPIIFTQYTDFDEHIRLFDKISKALESKTDKVVISFADPYKKITKKLEALQYQDILETKSKLYELIKSMSEIATSRNMIVESCSEEIDLDYCNIKHGKCIDDELIEKVFNISLNIHKDKNQRKECGCVQSVDIGVYNTCSHGCTYCYATFSDNTVEKNKLIHDSKSPLLIGNLEDLNEKALNELKNELTLF